VATWLRTTESGGTTVTVCALETLVSVTTKPPMATENRSLATPTLLATTALADHPSASAATVAEIVVLPTVNCTACGCSTEKARSVTVSPFCTTRAAPCQLALSGKTRNVGAAVGTTLGVVDGTGEGTCVGAAVGCAVGNSLGADEGAAVGATEGAADGECVGALVGVGEGGCVGAEEGTLDGASDGVADGAVDGAAVGASEG
jgi:hypothetical protein